MGIFRGGKSFFSRLGIDAAASAPDEPVRKAEHDAAVAELAPLSHRHGVEDIEDLAALFRSEIGLHIVDGDTIVWFTNDQQKRVAKIKLKPDGGLVFDADGLAVDFGPSGTQAAPGDHSHEQLHDPLTLAQSDSITAELGGPGDQELSLEVKIDPSGGLSIGPAGLGVDPDKVALREHTHAQLHPALTAQSSASLDLFVGDDQVLGGGVRLNPNPGSGKGRLGVTTDGLHVELGPSGTQAAAGNHIHQEATHLRSGFLSAKDKRKLDLYGALLQIEQSVSFHRHDPLPADEYVGGRHRWGQAMQVLNAHLVARAPKQETLLGLEVGGEVVEHFTIPGGPRNSEAFNFKSFISRHVEPDTYVRVRSVSGVGIVEDEASKVDVFLSLRPSIFTAPTVRLNAGGVESGIYASDAFYSGGSPISTSQPIDTSAVTNPAPQEVYRSARAKYFDTEPLIYTIPGLAKGLNHTVRVHFAEFYWNDPDQQIFRIEVTGATTQVLDNFDIQAAAGGKFRAVVREFTTKPDADGVIKIKLQPLPNAQGDLHCAINALELINGVDVVSDPVNLINLILEGVDKKVSKGGEESDRTMTAPLITPSLRLNRLNVPYAASFEVDFDLAAHQEIRVQGNITIASKISSRSNGVVDKSVVLWIFADDQDRTIDLAAGIRTLKQSPPFSVGANKVCVISLVSKGPNETDTHAVSAEEL